MGRVTSQITTQITAPAPPGKTVNGSEIFLEQCIWWVDIVIFFSLKTYGLWVSQDAVFNVDIKNINLP
jgi:hypothetical protein